MIMIIIQKEIQLMARSRGFHLVTSEIISQIPELKTILRESFAYLSNIHQHHSRLMRMPIPSSVKILKHTSINWYGTCVILQTQYRRSRRYAGTSQGINSWKQCVHPGDGWNVKSWNVAGSLFLRASQLWRCKTIGADTYWRRKRFFEINQILADKSHSITPTLFLVNKCYTKLF